MKHILTILFTSLFAVSTFAQQEHFLSIEGQNELQQTYHTPEADILSLISARSEASLQDEYLRLYGLFIAYQVNERELFANTFHKDIDQFEVQFDVSDRQQLMLVTLLIQQSLLHWNSGSNTDGARSFYKAHRLFRRINAESYPNEYQKLQAIFNVFLSQIPVNYQFWASLFGLEGDLNKGLSEMKQYAQTNINNQEAQVLYSYCLLKFGNARKKETILLIQQSQNNASPILNFVLASLAVKNRMGQDGLDFMESIEAKQFDSFPLLQYQHARVKLNQLDTNSYNALQSFLSNYSGNSFKTDAMMRQAWYFHIQHDNQKRDSLIQIIHQQTKLPTTNDRQAAKEVAQLKSVPVDLLKARLLYDGGFYNGAHQLLSTIDPNELESFYLAEFFYRLAKIDVELNKHLEAIQSFDKVIEVTQNDTRYIGPYAAIEAAKIMLSQNNMHRCRFYLEQASQLNTGEYAIDIKRKITAFNSKIDSAQ
ncbi:hypothetical protein [Carboxylicivirga marina]|uniref:Tetratricopeptide repeat protein n=1 Tax=Carboxylicivirga marina TaxID=2800988 RepID=A0ABS1HEX7_9BACT|nr:hypothetical protein [Carboxylicivirga marina]MBK3516030.1 hypothetical protein [Carboxylicivirga marina]